ncbi:winged helix-turn-helix domain-containing protein [Kaarinaea lacus]
MSDLSSESKTGHIPIDRTSPFMLGEWLVEPAIDRLIRGVQEVKLEPRVMDLLLCLASRPGEVLTREQLEASVWSGMVVGYDSLTSAMNKLRKALNDDPRNPQIIETVAKRGYRLIASITNVPPVTGGSEQESTEPTDTRTPAALRSTNRVIAAIVSGLIIVAAFGIYVVINKPSSITPATIDTTATRPGIVVLPFINLNDDPEQEYFSDGITEDLIVDLSRFSGLLVIARRSAFMYKTRSADIQSLAKELGVGYVVEGSVRRNNDNLRVNVQLVDAATGSNLWAQRFDRKTTDLFSVQDDIRRNIINALSITLTEEEQKREQQRYTHNFEAYDYFLRGQSSLVKRASANDNNQARELMEKAIALDPNFARAQAALALTYADAYRFNWTDDPQQTVRMALEIGERAIELDPHSPQAHWILGYIYLFLFNDHDRAIELGERTIQLDPNNADGYTLLGVTNAYSNNPERAKVLMQHLMRINPYYPSQVPGIFGQSSLLLGNYEEALAAYEESLLINPTRIPGNVYKIIILYRMGRIDDAKWQMEQLLSLHPDFDAKIWADRQPYRDRKIVEGFLHDLKQIGLN